MTAAAGVDLAEQGKATLVSSVHRRRGRSGKDLAWC